MLIEALGPKRQPACATFHKADAEFRVPIEDALADHVHHGDHQLEWKCSHVHVSVFAKTLAPRSHHAGDTEHAIVAGLRMHAEGHLYRLGAVINRIEHAIAHVIQTV